MVVYRSMEAIVRTFDRAIYEDVLALDGEYVNGTKSRQDAGVTDPLYRLASLQIDLSNLSHDLDLHSVFLLPALRDLRLEDCRLGKYDLKLDPLDLTRLVLMRCRLDLSSLFTILGACGGLCYFQYHWACGWWEDDDLDEDAADLGPRLYDGLYGSRQTLAHLDISGESPLWVEAKNLGDLTAFS